MMALATVLAVLLATPARASCGEELSGQVAGLDPPNSFSSYSSVTTGKADQGAATSAATAIWQEASTAISLGKNLKSKLSVAACASGSAREKGLENCRTIREALESYSEAFSRIQSAFPETRDAASRLSQLEATTSAVASVCPGGASGTSASREGSEGGVAAGSATGTEGGTRIGGAGGRRLRPTSLLAGSTVGESKEARKKRRAALKKHGGIRASCSGELQQFCSTTRMGQGRWLACLAKNTTKSGFGSQCSAFVKEVTVELGTATAESD